MIKAAKMHGVGVGTVQRIATVMTALSARPQAWRSAEGKRRRLMDAWSDFCNTPKATAGTVVSIGKDDVTSCCAAEASSDMLVSVTGFPALL